MISLYAKGLTTGDIHQPLLEIYGTEVSRATISKIADQIVDDMIAWQSRPAGPALSGLADRRSLALPAGLLECPRPVRRRWNGEHRQPRRSSQPEIWVGGSSERAVQRALALGDAWHPSRGSDADHVRRVKQQ